MATTTRTRTADTALTIADRAFALLTCEPAPLVFDTRPVPGLPDATMPLHEFRQLLMVTRYDSDITDALAAARPPRPRQGTRLGRRRDRRGAAHADEPRGENQPRPRPARRRH